MNAEADTVGDTEKDYPGVERSDAGETGGESI